MLAEIFMVRLEAAARVPEEMAPSSNTRFVPFPIATSRIKQDSANIGVAKKVPFGHICRPCLL